MTNEKMLKKFENKVVKILLDRYDGTRQLFYVGQILGSSDSYLHLLDLEETEGEKEVLISHHVIESILTAVPQEEQHEETDDDVEVLQVGTVQNPLKIIINPQTEGADNG